MGWHAVTMQPLLPLSMSASLVPTVITLRQLIVPGHTQLLWSDQCHSDPDITLSSVSWHRRTQTVNIISFIELRSLSITVNKSLTASLNTQICLSCTFLNILILKYSHSFWKTLLSSHTQNQKVLNLPVSTTNLCILACAANEPKLIHYSGCVLFSIVIRHPASKKL